MTSAKQIIPPIESNLHSIQENGNGTVDQVPVSEQPKLAAAIERTIEEQQSRLTFAASKFEFDQRRAKVYAISGMFGGKPGDKITLEEAVAQALVRIELGESMGFSAAESLQGINVIANRAAVSAELQAARMQAAGFGWDVEFHWAGREYESECTGCTLWMKFRQRPMLDHSGQQVSVSFLKSHALQMKTTIWENGAKKRVTLLEKWEHGEGALKEDMYFARAITRLRRRHAPAVMSPSVLSIDEAMDLESEPVTVVMSEAKPEPEKQSGNAALKHTLKATENTETVSTKTTRNEQSNVVKKGSENNPPGGTVPAPGAPHRSPSPRLQRPKPVQDPVFNSVDEMEEFLRQLSLDMTEEFGDAGQAEFDRIVKNHGGYPKTIAAGETIASLLMRFRNDIKQLDLPESSEGERRRET